MVPRSSRLTALVSLYGSGASALLTYRAVQLVNSLAISIVLARRFGLEMIGTFAIGFIAVLFVTMLSPLGLPSQLARVRQPHARVCTAGLMIQLAQWPVVVLVLYAYAWVQGQSASEAHVIFLVALNGPLLAFLNVGIALSVIASRESDALVAAAAESAGTLAACALGHDGAAFASWLLVGRSAGCLLVWSGFRFSWIRWSRVSAIGRRSVAYMVPEVLGLLAEQTGPILLSLSVPRAELGVFRLCQQLLNAADTPVAAFVQARYPSLVRATYPLRQRLLRRVTQMAVLAGVLCFGGSAILARVVYRTPRLVPMMTVLSVSLVWRYRGYFYEQTFRAAGSVGTTSAIGVFKVVASVPVVLALTLLFGVWGAIWSVLIMAIMVESAYRLISRRYRPALILVPEQ